MIQLEILVPLLSVVSRRPYLVQALLAAESDPDGETIEDLTKKLWCGCGPSGLILLERVNHQTGAELFVYGLAGRGILAQGHAVMRDLRKIAEAIGCVRIGGNSLHPSLDRFYKSLGLKEVARQYRMELG